MNTEENKKIAQDTDVQKADAPKTDAPKVDAPVAEKTVKRAFVKNESPRKFKRGFRSKFDRPKPEFEQKILNIRRVTRVVKGGRRFSFSVAMIIGDKKGVVGVGMGKATDTALAIGKALKDARKHLIKLPLTKDMSIPHDIKEKFTSSVVMLMPNGGKGIVAGSAVRDLLVLAGVKDVSAKILSGSKNKMNNAQATINALKTLHGTKSYKPKGVEKKKEGFKREGYKREGFKREPVKS
ncbi:30S ribosomal protein S5 [Candidatus Wolfebacteria bacterium]|nr:MAG: 30S ribosomal protein S5 [Candidatus Wolfebacteria bacterium]